MALKYNRDTQRRAADLTDYPAGVDVIYSGGLVTLAAGYAVAGQAVAGYRFVGVAEGQCDNSAGAAGSRTVNVWKNGEFLLEVSGSAATQADVGKRVWLVSDDKVSLTRQLGDIIAGEIRGIESSGTQVWVDIAPGTQEKQNGIITLSGSITAVTSATQAVALANPFGERVIILDAILDVTTASSGAAAVDMGIAANGTTSSDVLLDGVDVNSAVIIAESVTNKGSNGRRARAWATSEYVTVTSSATLAGLVGTYTLVCLVPTAR